MAAKSVLQQILSLTEKFVSSQKGEWEHDEWEGWLDKVGALGVELTDETKRNLGNILESCKHFYGMKVAKPPAKAKAAPAKKKAAAKKKTAEEKAK